MNKRLEITSGLQATYNGVKAHIKAKGHTIIAKTQDIRGDWGDDGGYMVVATKKNNHYYLMVIFISHNTECKGLKLDLEDTAGCNEYEDDFPFFFVYDSIESLKNGFEEYIETLEICVNDGLLEEYDHPCFIEEAIEDLGDGFKDVSNEDKVLLGNILTLNGSSFYEDEEDNLQNLKDMLEYIASICRDYQD